MRKLILGTASILALGIGGAALDYTADTGEAAESASTPPAFEISHAPASAGNLSKDEVRWAQLELRNRGLYSGSLDGVVGRETKHAVAQFQKDNGLSPTTALDQETMEVLVGHSDIGQGSSTPPNLRATRPVTSSSGVGDFGNQAAPR